MALALVFCLAPLIPLLRGPTLDTWSIAKHDWLYAVHIYIANHEGWSFSYLDHFCRSPSRNTSTCSGRWWSSRWLAGRAHSSR
jgi:hypothetical protein